LLHMSMPQAVPALERVSWPESSENKELEFETLNDMSSYLAGAAGLYQASTVSFLAGNIPSEGKANLVSDSAAGAHLRLEADYERSWAAVGRALERAGVVIAGQDQEQGVYDVTFTIIPEEEERGFFASLFTLDRFTREAPRDHLMRVRVRNAGNNVVEVSVEDVDTQEPIQDADAEPVDPEASLLRTIMNYIA